MNKKFINLLLASVLAVSSAQVFTSCKDNEADLQANVQYQYESLEKRVAANEDFIKNTLPGQLQTLENNLTTKINNVQTTLDQQMKDYKQQLLDSIAAAKAELLAKIQKNEGDIKVLQDSVADLDSLYKALKGELDDLKDDYGKFKDDFATYQEEVLNKFLATNTTLQNLRDSIKTNINDIANLRTDLTIVQARQDSIVEVLKRLPELENKVDNIDAQVQNHSERITLLESALLGTQTDLANLTTKVDDYIAATDGRLQPLEDFMNNWKDVLPVVAEQAEVALSMANANAASIAAINTTIEDLIDADASNASMITGLQMQINDMLARMDEFATLTELAEVSSYLQEQASKYFSQSIGYTNLMIEQVLAQFAKDMDNVNNEFNNVYAEIGTVKDFQDALNNRVTALEGNYSTLAADVATLTARVGDIESNLAEATNRLSNRIEEVSNRISGIVIQGTENNSIGSLRLPIGIQSNLLIAYLGEVANASGEVTFPLVAETAGTYNGDISNSLTEAEAAVLSVGNKVPIETISGLYMTSTESNPNAGYLGTVYATINPTKVDLDGKNFNLVNSRGERIVNPLTFVPSDKELEFGYSRSAENGFYEAEASVDINNSALNSIRFILNESFKKTVEDILETPRESVNLNTVLKLANAVVDQLNGFLPAIGIEASWTDSELGQMCVTSNYAIATSVVKPLSFAFLQSKSFRNIPNLPTISQLQDKFNVIYDEVKGDLTIDLTGETVSFDLGGGVHGKLNVNIVLPSLSNPMVYVSVLVDGKTGMGSGTVNLNNYESALQDVVDAINQAFADYDASIDTANADLQAAFDDVANQVNNLVQSIEVKVNTTLQDVAAELQDKVNGLFVSHKASQIENLMNRINSVINRLNRVLDNPNHYLQPTLFYTTKSNEFGEVSRNSYLPTQVVLVGDANALTIVPTTYTYETVVPVYKKYVAVTKAWNTETGINNDHVALEANNNSGFNTYMNQVVDGSCRKVALKLQKGFTYEIFYQALDFNGYVSGGKYYISVK